MITVEEAEKIILRHTRDYGTEEKYFHETLGMVLAEDIIADRDMPAFNRATMDGVALCHAAFTDGLRSFRIKGIQSAGETPIELNSKEECIEIMTGAAVPSTADTVIRYEDLEVKEGMATLLIDNIKKGQNIHRRGVDKKQGDIVVQAGTLVTATTVSAAAFTGNENLVVKRTPKIVAISSGDELQDVSDVLSPYKIRRSNSYTIKTALQQQKLDADLIHLPDDETILETELGKCLNKYDAIIVSGGVSMGKFDLVAKTLEKLKVEKLFHKVKQRPGKPFWFGKHESGTLVFAFPGNPVSTFMCFHRYFLPWYRKSAGLSHQKCYAVLDKDISFAPTLQYFLQVTLLSNESGQVIAMPVEGNGSGDLANLVEADAFMELPMDRDNFKKGEAYVIWPFKTLI